MKTACILVVATIASLVAIGSFVGVIEALQQRSRELTQTWLLLHSVRFKL